MPNQDAVVRLILIEDRIEDAEQVIAILRNAGMAVRPYRPESLAEFGQIVEQQPVDLVLVGLEAKTIPFREVIAAANASDKDLAVIALTRAVSEQALAGAFAAGAAAIGLPQQPNQLQAVVRIQYNALRNRRAVRRLEAALRESERRCDALIATSSEPIAYIHEGMHIRANAAYLQMFGYDSFDDVEGLPILDMVAGTCTEEFKTLLKRLSKGEPPPKALELTAQRADGSHFEAVMEFAQASYEGEPCLQIVFRQQLLDAAMARELDELRQRDAVTGLYNRQHLIQVLESAVAEAAKGRGDQALLLLEPDNHAAVLADLGLDRADALLKAIAERIAGTLGSEDLAARFSDHGFAVLLRKADHSASQEYAQNLCAAFQGHILEVGERSLGLNVSIGGVQIGEKIASVPQVLARANQCLQSVIGVGGNRCELFDPAARDRAEEELIQAWVKRTREALRGDGFLLHYQPIIGLHGQPGEIYEAFVRMKGGAGDAVAPANFMSIAEEHGLLADIDRWVIGRAIDVLAQRRAAGRDTCLFVKLSSISLGSAILPEFIADRLRKLKLPGKCLVLEIQESKVVTQLKAAQELQQKIAPLGVRVALEQFGAGLNSFQLLEHFQPDLLKIDRSFIADLGKSAENQKKVKEIATKAQELGKQTVAEFVQDAATMTVLFSCGVDFVEGHFLATATPEMNYDFG